MASTELDVVHAAWDVAYAVPDDELDFCGELGPAVRNLRRVLEEMRDGSAPFAGPDSLLVEVPRGKVVSPPDAVDPTPGPAV